MPQFATGQTKRRGGDVDNKETKRIHCSTNDVTRRENPTKDQKKLHLHLETCDFSESNRRIEKYTCDATSAVFFAQVYCFFFFIFVFFKFLPIHHVHAPCLSSLQMKPNEEGGMSITGGLNGPIVQQMM